MKEIYRILNIKTKVKFFRGVIQSVKKRLFLFCDAVGWH